MNYHRIHCNESLLYGDFKGATFTDILYTFKLVVLSQLLARHAVSRCEAVG
jgi:hypothetical protein